MKYILVASALILSACSHMDSFEEEAYDATPQSPTISLNHDPYGSDRPRGLYPVRRAHSSVSNHDGSESRQNHFHNEFEVIPKQEPIYSEPLDGY